MFQIKYFKYGGILKNISLAKNTLKYFM